MLDHENLIKVRTAYDTVAEADAAADGILAWDMMSS